MYVAWLKQCGKENLPLVGGKNANLGEMLNSGIPVPPGFAVTAKTYAEAITPIKEEVFSILSKVKPDDSISAELISKRVRQLFRDKTVTIPSEAEEAIDNYYRALGDQCGMIDPPVAVRSSATAEDLPSASFAGQQETYLWIRGKEELKKYIIDCWSSLFTSRAILYRIKKGFPHEKVLISVSVQQMVDAKVAGVIFTLNPANGDPSKIALCGSWGLGETVVSGEVTPDEWLVDKVVFEIVEQTISAKMIERIVDEEGKVIVRGVTSERQEIPCLSDEEVIGLARVAKLIESHYGVAQDIEWAMDKNLPFPENLFILQARPETVWTHRKRESLVKSGEAAMDYILKLAKSGWEK